MFLTLYFALACQQRHPDRVFLIVGNRDLNKLRYTAELGAADMGRPIDAIPRVRLCIWHAKTYSDSHSCEMQHYVLVKRYIGTQRPPRFASTCKQSQAQAQT